MPLQRFDTSPVPRPSGLVPPVPDLSGVTELRLHGVGGTTPEDLLGDVAPQRVSGNRIAGFYRTADVHGRHVEAYSWGGLTSRSGFRVLWLLLFPFALANVAGWMCTRRTHRSRVLFWLHRTLVRWAALGITVNLLLVTAMASMDLVAYQCGGQQACAGSWWPLHFLRYALLADYPARRILAGAALPIAVVVGLAILTLRSITRYEDVEPPFRGQKMPDRVASSAAKARGGLADYRFWDGRGSAVDLGCLHVASALAFVAVGLAHVVRTTSHEAAADIVEPRLWTASLALGGLAFLGALMFTMLGRCPPFIAPALVVVAIVAMLCASLFALTQPGLNGPQPLGPLPGMRDVANWAFGTIFGLVLLVLVPAILGGWKRGSFVAFGPFVALVLSVTVLNVVMLGTMIRMADLLAQVSVRSNIPEAASASPVLYVSDVIGRSTPYLTLVPLVLIALFVLYEVVGYWRAGRRVNARRRIREWYNDNVMRPAGEEGWYYSTTAADVQARRTRLRRLMNWMLGQDWEAGVARARRFARMPRQTDKLLTTLAFTGVLLFAASQYKIWVLDSLPWGTSWTLTIGSYLAAAVPILVILLLRRGWRSLTSRRHIGVIWDVTTFWPRAYHPLAPPSYAERAVPELQRRLWRLHDSGGRVVLAAHSQGSIIATAALLQRECRPPDDVIALVTFGSPLRTLYHWGFPAYFNDDVLEALLPRDGSDARLQAWRNCYYQTDYIGGAVFADGASTNVDVELPDPLTCWHIYGQPKPSAGRHSGYWDDAAVWQYVDQFAQGVASASRIPPPRRPDATDRAL